MKNKPAKHEVVATVLQQQADYGRLDIGKGKSVHLEFVSVTPTGPLHVSHGRVAAYGSALANLLESVGYQVTCEYNVNDTGRQMHILAISVWLRYLELCGERVAFPSNAYQGDYVFDIAADVHRSIAAKCQHSWREVSEGIALDADQPDSDKEVHIDGLIAKAKHLLGEADYRLFFDAALNTLLKDIKQDLRAFGVVYEQWFSERSLFDSGEIDKTIEELKVNNYIYEQDGNWWLRSSELGDEKDRMLQRADGSKTDYAADIAYYRHKYRQGYDQFIDIMGAGQRGYATRLKAAIQALNLPVEKLQVLPVSFAELYRGKEKVQMSTHSDDFVTLRELREEVGRDAARFFYVLRKGEQPLDFDLQLASSKSDENPVYYIQCAHARICSVLRQLSEKGLSYDQQLGLKSLWLLSEAQEMDLLSCLSRYPEVVEIAARAHEPHHIAHYLRDLAKDFHNYYNAQQFLVDQAEQRNARLALISACRQVLQNGLAILGVSAPESM